MSEEERNDENRMIGQVRQHYDIQATTSGAGLTDTHHIRNVTTEVWTGEAWVDVRELVDLWNSLPRATR